MVAYEIAGADTISIIKLPCRGCPGNGNCSFRGVKLKLVQPVNYVTTTAQQIAQITLLVVVTTGGLHC